MLRRSEGGEWVVERSDSEQPSNQEEEQSQEGSLHVLLFGKSFRIEYHPLISPIQLQRTCTCMRVRTTPKSVKTFDQLLAGEYIIVYMCINTNNLARPPLDHSEQLRLSEEELRERVLRGERAVHLSLPAGPTRKRKPLSEEQLLERRRKVRFLLNKVINIPVG